MPVVLATDALFFTLLAALAAGALWIARRPHLRAPWRKLAARRAALPALVVIAFYVLVALLDSLHFRPRLEAPDGEAVYGPEVMSVFDLLVRPAIVADERSYSAPLATHAHSRETVQTAAGAARVLPRLEHGGAHLSDPARERWPDVGARAATGAAQGLAVMLAVFALACALGARRRGLSALAAMRRVAAGRTRLPWRGMWLSAAAVVVLAFVCAQLASGYHVLGTDKVGQDVLYQALKSIRAGFLIGTLTTLLMLPLALALGVAAGYFLGWVDDVIQYLYTTLNSIPGVLLIAAAALMLHLYMDRQEFVSLAARADLRLLFLCVILGVTSWTGLCRLLRAETLKVKTMDYVAAARTLGVGRFVVLRRHVLPNVMHIVFITIALDFSGLVLAEAVLSYVNIGVDPTMPSWGNMINAARLEMAREPVVWWSLGAAMAFMFTLVLCANLFADAVRDAFDPNVAA